MNTKLKKILFGNFIFLFSLVLILIINIAILFFPLTNVFGFEFSFVNAILISFLAGITSISHLRNKLNTNNIYFFYFGIFFLMAALINSLKSGCGFGPDVWPILLPEKLELFLS